MTERIKTNSKELGGSFPLPGTSMKVKRMGYGAMQLAGPQVWGPPRDVDAAIGVLREAVASGVNHIDTSDYYGRTFTMWRRGTMTASLTTWQSKAYLMCHSSRWEGLLRYSRRRSTQQQRRCRPRPCRLR